MQGPTAPPSFFIADKLRGIPLVTATRTRQPHQNQRRRNDNRLQDITTTTTTTTTRTPPPRARTSSNSTNRKPENLVPVLTKPVVQKEPSNRKPVPVSGSRLGKLLRTVALEPTRRPPSDNVAVDLQRRASPSLVGTRFTTSKPADKSTSSNGGLQLSGAGKNWHLFNSSGGNTAMAPFEILALAANLLIAGTLILVILMNWVRCLRAKKDKQTSAKQQMPNTSNNNNNNNNNKPADSSATGAPSSLVKAPATRKNNDGTENKTRPQLGGSTSGLSVYPPSSVTPSMAESKLSESGLSSALPKSATTSPLAKDAIVEIDKQSAEARVENSKEEPLNEKNASSTVLRNQPKEVVPKEPASQLGKGMAIKQPGDTVILMKKELEQAKELGSRLASAGVAAGGGPNLADYTNKEKVSVKDQTTPANLKEPPTTPSESVNQKQALDNKLKQVGPPTDGRQSVGSLESVELPAALVGSGNKNGIQEQTQKEDAASPRENLLLTLKQAEVEAEHEKRRQPVSEPVVRAEAEPPEHTGQHNSRPENPMSEHLGVTVAPEVDSPQPGNGESALAMGNKRPLIVTNKLDKRKTELEIVDLRDSSVAGKINGPTEAASGEPADEPTGTLAASHKEGWISMDEVAVRQPSGPGGGGGGGGDNSSLSVGKQALTPADIIESRFKVDYKEKPSLKAANSFDSRRELEATLEADAEPELSRTKNKKYFVYIVQDGHFSARKECIAQIELPSRKRVTLAEMRTMIANSQDISLASLRRNKFKFVTETYRLLNENEDATVLHQVYPTQGVFLKLNIAEQESLSHLRASTGNAASKGRGSGLLRIQPASGNQTAAATAAQPPTTSGGGAPGTARRRSRTTDTSAASRAATAGRTRARSTGRRSDKSSSQIDKKTGARNSVPDVVEPEAEEPQVIGRSISRSNAANQLSSHGGRGSRSNSRNSVNSIGANMMHGAKRLFDATFNRQSQAPESANVSPDVGEEDTQAADN